MVEVVLVSWILRFFVIFMVSFFLLSCMVIGVVEFWSIVVIVVLLVFVFEDNVFFIFCLKIWVCIVDLFI